MVRTGISRPTFSSSSTGGDPAQRELLLLDRQGPFIPLRFKHYWFPPHSNRCTCFSQIPRAKSVQCDPSTAYSTVGAKPVDLRVFVGPRPNHRATETKTDRTTARPSPYLIAAYQKQVQFFQPPWPPAEQCQKLHCCDRMATPTHLQSG